MRRFEAVRTFTSARMQKLTLIYTKSNKNGLLRLKTSSLGISVCDNGDGDSPLGSRLRDT
jgi:hypothetical protein